MTGPTPPVGSLTGRRLGSYQVFELIGAGGMGEVYRARDTRLDRDVAIKILPAALTTDADRLVRFEREARVLASVSHPHIAAIYGVEDVDGIQALVLELIPGKTLAERIADGPMPAGDALSIARQIADAIDAAHEKGIVHRDLKPANIKIAADGAVKVLDFGLAKVGADAAATAHDATVTAATREGVILGTAAYMSPEQARGLPVDKRTDIWAFGCVLFEMLTGRLAFSGTTTSDLVAAILEHDPDWTQLPASTPGAVRRLLRRCLEKDPRRRLRDIGDARIELEGMPDDAAAPAASGRSPRRTAGLVAVAVAAGAGLGWIAATAIDRDVAAPASPQLFVETLPQGRTFEAGNAGTGTVVALSPNGRTLAYVANEGGETRLFVRTLDRLDQLRASRISEEVIREPFFSPDGEWIGFREGLTLKRISLQGGPAETIATLPAGTAGAHGIVWSADGTILVGAGQTGLVRVRAGSGEVETLITKERGILYPQALPDGKTLIYTESAGATSDGGQIALFDLASRTSRTLRPGSAARYLPSGHLVFVAGGTLWGMGFDIERLELRGTAVPLVTGVRVNPEVVAPQFALTDAGALAYLPVASSRRTLVWVDRQGKETPVGVPPRAYGFPRVSPDGTRIAVTIKDSDQDVHLWDVSRKVLRQLTFDPAANNTLSWLGNDRLAYSSQVAGWGQVFERRADGLGPARQVTSGLPSFPFAATPDGTILFVREFPPDSRWDIGVVPMQNPASRQTVERTTASENNPVLSPDGRWLTYQSNKTGRFEIYVRPFPLSGQGDIAITAEGGTRPVWARDGSELYYWTAGRSTVAIKAIRVTAGEPSSWGAPETVVEGPFVTAAFDTDYDVWDGRFLLMKDHADDGVLPAQEVVVVQNWIQELRRLVPGK